MKILLTIDNRELEKTDFLKSGNLVSCPREIESSQSSLLCQLVDHGATGLIAHRRPSEALLCRWRDILRRPIYIAYIIGVEHTDDSPNVCDVKIPDGSLNSIATALRHFEHSYSRARIRRSELKIPRDHGDVVLVGAGIVNLLTALYLNEQGYKITIIDASPQLGGDWKQYGCTHSGDDARMFSLTEMDNYNNRTFYGKNANYFRTPIRDGGWLALNRNLLPEEEKWVAEFESIPSWLAQSYNDDIYALNSESFTLWSELREKYPEIFAESFFQSNILRLYSDDSQYRSDVARHERIGALLQNFTSDELAKEYPALRSPISRRKITGGLLAPGFTVNVHKFAAQLMRHLREHGAKLLWGSAAKRTIRSDHGLIQKVEFDCDLPRNAHVVASPGAYGRHLLEGSACEDKIQGVLGGWMRLPNRSCLRHSIKLARRGHITEDANITLGMDADGRDVLIIGSGYGYTGLDPNAADSCQIEAIREGILDTIHNCLSEVDQEQLISSQPNENYGFKYCVRPWTSTSLGLFHAEVMTDECLFLVTGGHNTGGFAQAPSVAAAVSARLGGQAHPMHWMYHPCRLNNFVGSPDQDAMPSSRSLREPAVTHRANTRPGLI